MTNLLENESAGAALRAAARGSAPGDWVAELSLTVAQTETEKTVLAAIDTLGSFQIDPHSADYPEALDTLVERELVRTERVGETYTKRGVANGDGFDVYRLSEIGKLWLANCQPAVAKG